MQSILASFGEKLLVPLLSTEQTRDEYTCSVNCKQCSNGVEFGREDLQDDQCEAELRKCRPDIRSLKHLECSALVATSVHQTLPQMCVGPPGPPQVPRL